MSDNTKFGNGIDLTPITNDPANPVDGGIYYFDGTNRAKGIWTYNGTSFVQSGTDPVDEKTIKADADLAIAETGSTIDAARTIGDDANRSDQANIFFDIPSGATSFGTDFTFDYSFTDKTGTAGNIELWLYETKIKKDYPLNGSSDEVSDNSKTYYLLGSVAVSSLVDGDVRSTATISLANVDLSALDSGSGAVDMRGKRACLAITTPWGSAGVSQLPLSAGLKIHTSFPTGNPQRLSYGIESFSKTTFGYGDALNGNVASSIKAFQVDFEVLTGDAGDLTVPSNSLGQDKLTDSAVTSRHIKDGVITEAKLAAGATDSVAANRQLSNLTSPALVNATLLPDDENLRSIGIQTNPWLEMNAKAFEISDGTNARYNKTWTGAAVTEGLTNGISRKSALNVPARYVEEHYIDALTITASQTNAVLLTLDGVDFEGVTIDYKVKTSTGVKHGTIKIATDSTAVAITDVSTELNSSDVTFNAQMNGTDVEITYSSVAAGTMIVDMKKFQA